MSLQQLHWDTGRLNRTDSICHGYTVFVDGSLADSLSCGAPVAVCVLLTGALDDYICFERQRRHCHFCVNIYYWSTQSYSAHVINCYLYSFLSFLHCWHADPNLFWGPIWVAPPVSRQIHRHFPFFQRFPALLTMVRWRMLL